MRKLFRLFGILALGAGLSMAVVSCQREEFSEFPQDEATPIRISVGAGFANDPATRSAVVTDDVTGTRTLTFTEGDRLYIVAEISGTEYYLSGYLAIDPLSISPDGTSATFVGDYGDDIAAYYEEIQEIDEEEYVEFIQIDHVFNSEDIFGECEDIVGVLVHKDAGDNGFIVENDDLYYYYFDSSLKPTVEEVMEQCLIVEGEYNPETNRFVLGIPEDDYGCTPILNCRISGLEHNTTYRVYYLAYHDDGNAESYGLGDLTTEEDDEVSFACCMDWVDREESLRTLVFVNNADESERKLVVLGKKEFSSKIYNVTREAVSFEWPDIEIDGATATELDKYGVSHYLGDDGEDSVIDVAFSGTSKGYAFRFGDYKSATVTFDGLTASLFSPEFLLLSGEDDSEVVLNVSGANSISNQACESSIRVWGGILKLSGNGTLAVTCSRTEYCGIRSDNYESDDSDEDCFNFYEDTDERDVSAQLAASGYTVIRSARTDNEDGTYTWTYTVCATPRIVRTDVTPNVVVEKNDQGTYVLEDSGEYSAYGTIDGDISGSGNIALTLEDGTVIKGTVTLTDEGTDAPCIIVDGEASVSELHTGDGTSVFTFLSIGGTLYVTGDFEGHAVSEVPGTLLVVQGDILSGSIVILMEQVSLWVYGDIATDASILDYMSNDITDYYYEHDGFKEFYGGDVVFDDPDDPEPEDPEPEDPESEG